MNNLNQRLSTYVITYSPLLINLRVIVVGSRRSVAVGRSVGWLICVFVFPHVFWSGVVQEQHVYGGGQKIYILLY